MKKIKRFLIIIVVIIIAIIGIQFFRYQTGYFPSQNMISKFEDQVEVKMEEHLIDNGYTEEEIQKIEVDKIPKARKRFDVTVIFENGNIISYVVDDVGQTDFIEK